MLIVLYYFLSSYCSSNFAIAKVFDFNLFASFFVSVLYVGSLLLFVIAFHICNRFSNYCNSFSFRSFSLLKAMAKSNRKLFFIASKIEKERQLTNSNNFRKSDKEAKKLYDISNRKSFISKDHWNILLVV